MLQSKLYITCYNLVHFESFRKSEQLRCFFDTCLAKIKKYIFLKFFIVQKIREPTLPDTSSVRCLENTTCHVLVHTTKDNNGTWYFINKVESILIDIHCCLFFSSEDFISNYFLHSI